MKIADHTLIVHIINDRLMRGDFVGYRVNEQLDKIVVAFNIWNGIPYLHLDAGLKTEELLG